MNNLMQHSNPHAQMLMLYLIGLLRPCKAGVAGRWYTWIAQCAGYFWAGIILTAAGLSLKYLSKSQLLLVTSR